MITVISFSQPIENLKDYILNWEEVPNNVKELLLSGSDFWDKGQEILIYNGNRIIASCSTGYMCEEESSRRDIINCWTREGNLWT